MLDLMFSPLDRLSGKNAVAASSTDLTVGKSLDTLKISGDNAKSQSNQASFLSRLMGFSGSKSEIGKSRSRSSSDLLRATGKRTSINDFNFLSVLGKGYFGKVMLVEEKKSGKLFAIKLLKKDFIIENEEIER
jgi:hypothetical protein